MRIKSCTLRAKAGPADGLAEGEFLVYPSTFTRTPDAYGDVVAPGAFLETIEEWKASGNTLPGLYGHRLDDPDFFVAGAVDMGEDEHGWWVKGAFDLESPRGEQVYRLVKGRRLNQLSFAFDVLDEGTVTLEDGSKANELRRLKVYEFSFVPIGANQDTSVVAIKATAAALADGIKAGRVLSQKNTDSLRAVSDQLAEAKGALDAVIAAAEGDDQGEANNEDEAKDEEPRGAKSEEPTLSAHARAQEIISVHARS